VFSAGSEEAALVRVFVTDHVVPGLNPMPRIVDGFSGPILELK
jgi:hypothetical protein